MMSTTTALSEADKANTTTTTTTAAAAEPSRAQHGNDDDRGNNMASDKAEAPSGGGNVNHSNNSNKKNDGSDDAITNDQGDAAASASTSTRTTRTSPRLRKAAKAPPPTPTSERKRKRKNASAGTAAIGTMITATTVTKSKKRGKLSNNNSNAKNKNSNDKSAEDDVETNNNNQASTVVNHNDDYDDEDEDEDEDESEDGPKGDGRKNNKGSAKRESYSVAFKAKAVRDFEEWEKEQRSQGNDNPAVRHYCLTRNLGNKYIKFLSPTNGWRSPGVRERILQDAGIGDYKDLARMTDRTKNKSYYAEMEEALLKRLQEYKERNITVSNKTIRQLAKEELRKSTNDEEKVNAFKASNGWVHNFLKRQERKEKDMQRKVKNTQPTKHKNNAKQIVQQKEQGVGDANTNP